MRVINPNLAQDEEQRIYYVGISRAINRLFIVTPKLSKANREIIKSKFNFKMIDLKKELQII
ncbi:hypothetical protein [Priestia flexa]|uniref:hypothetical protein n=1 Tax=Priestia flexa TaxID=86664 RepID=UPI001115A1CB|nr:hypothetical protein [Priestia flexa]